MSDSQVDKYERLKEEGILAYEKRNYKAAVDALLQVTDRQPKNWTAKLYLALSYSRLGDQLMSRPLLRFLATSCPDAEIKARAEGVLSLSVSQQIAGPKQAPAPTRAPTYVSYEQAISAPEYRPGSASNRPCELVNTANGKRHSLAEAKVCIGSSATNQVVLLKDPFVSGVQAIVTREGDEVFVEDGIVINPTKVNGKSITGKTKLAPGDAIKLGNTIFKLN